ncbi:MULTISPECIES: GDSL-type esterase/lipase family protein [Pacificibacter]|uniref:GDSL-type esterase/lipase family protein n=1 Tax=Pacificibacter TaxID=1042323 RepID=UPI001C096ED2|nr:MULTISPECIES: GDSL-type esterase/lipase family protein [Pacificibacter]MBU2937419.1 GDSL family lipase [Pacificibacter marinus]MDO6617061.1 GDSL-type esterase/lipase family protein [Pacificibacter sp. 1_MG-2023]
MEKTVVCFGDSNTWGCEPFEHPNATPRRMPKERRWTNVMVEDAKFPIKIIEEGLSGRTTVFDDPIEGEHKNGSRLLVACLETHAPLDLVIIMLGTNDFKTHFNVSSFTSARGILTLIQLIKGYYVLSDDCPEILIVTPPSIDASAEVAFWGDAAERCIGHADYLNQVAERTGCFHFDCNLVAGAVKDGIHLDDAGHRALGQALAPQVMSILEMRS